jgi:hypothetical protein
MSARTQRNQLQVDEDLAYQQTEWRTERVGWVIWIAAVAAAFAGLLGPGPYSSTEFRSSDQQLVIEYNRIARRRADSEIQIRVAPTAAQQDHIRLYLSANFLLNETIEGIQPQPREVVHDRERVEYVFPISNAETVVITFRVQPGRLGRHDYTFGVESGPSVRLWRFILP